jgi:hypothetical protein
MMLCDWRILWIPGREHELNQHLGELDTELFINIVT